jgi:hypothetical protein
MENSTFTMYSMLLLTDGMPASLTSQLQLLSCHVTCYSIKQALLYQRIHDVVQLISNCVLCNYDV